MSRGLGAFGEAWATGQLVRRGYKIVDRNVRYRTGEIDIVAWDGPHLVFVEVKCRRSRQFGTPTESITPARYARLAAAVQQYLTDRDLEPDSYRVDVVGIEVGANGKVARWELLQGVEPPSA